MTILTTIVAQKKDNILSLTISNYTKTIVSEFKYSQFHIQIQTKNISFLAKFQKNYKRYAS